MKKGWKRTFEKIEFQVDFKDIAAQAFYGITEWKYVYALAVLNIGARMNVDKVAKLHSQADTQVWLGLFWQLACHVFSLPRLNFNFKRPSLLVPQCQQMWPPRCHRSCTSTMAGRCVYEKGILPEEEAMKQWVTIYLFFFFWASFCKDDWETLAWAISQFFWFLVLSDAATNPRLNHRLHFYHLLWIIHFVFHFFPVSEHQGRPGGGRLGVSQFLLAVPCCMT